MLEVGRRVVIHYPEDNAVNKLPRFEIRPVTIYRVRDLVKEPIKPSEFMRDPFIRRSRWLVMGFDENIGGWRNFYLGATREFQSPATLKIGLYEPESEKPYKVLPRIYEPTVRDMAILRKVLKRLSEENLGDLRARLFSDDLRLFKAS